MGAERPIPQTDQILTVPQESEIDLVELFYFILHRVWLVAVAAVVAAVLTFFYTSIFITPLYQSTATLYVYKSKDIAASVDVSGLSAASQLTNDYIQLFTLWPVTEDVITTLNLPYTSRQLIEMTTVTNPANTRYLNITVKSRDAEEAMKIANSLGKAAQSIIKEKFKTDEPTELAPARVSKIIVYPNKLRNTLMGGVLGGIGVIAVLFLIFIMDDKVKRAEDMMKYFGLANLAVIPLVGTVTSRPTGQKNEKHRVNESN